MFASMNVLLSLFNKLREMKTVIQLKIKPLTEHHLPLEYLKEDKYLDEYNA